MKYVIFIPDGSSDYPVDELDGKTPLQVANTPNIDKLGAMVDLQIMFLNNILQVLMWPI